MGQGRAPVLLWQVGCWGEVRERQLWQGTPGNDTWVDSVDCATLPDGTAVAVCGTGDGALQIWDLATRSFTSTPGQASQYATRLTCARLPDGTPVTVAVTNDGALRVWDLPTGRLRAATNSRVLSPWSSLACTDGAAVTGDDAGVRFWDLATAQPLGEPLPGTHVACAGDVVVVGDGGTIRGPGADPIEVGFHVNILRCLRLTDGAVLAVAGSGRERDDDGRRHGVVRAWDVATGLPYGPPMTGHGGEINALACVELPDGTAIAVTVDRYESVRCVNLRTGLAHGPSLPGGAQAVASGRLSDGRPVVVAAGEEIRLWSLAVRPSEHGFTGPVWMVGHVRLPDGEVLVTAGQESDGDSVQLWDSATGRLLRRLHTDPLPVGCVGTTMVAATSGGLRLRDLSTEDTREVALAGQTGRPWVVACRTQCDGTPIVLTGGEFVRAWRITDGQPYGPALPVRGQDIATVPLPDGTLIVFARDDRARAWDAATGQPYGPRFDDWRVHERAVDCLALPDGTPVAIRAKTGAVEMWDLATGNPHGDPVPLHTADPTALAATLLPDGTVLAAVVGEDGHVVELVDPITGTWHPITTPESVMDLAFTGEHRLVVRTYLDITVYDVTG